MIIDFPWPPNREFDGFLATLCILADGLAFSLFIVVWGRGWVVQNFGASLFRLLAHFKGLYSCDPRYGC